MAEKIFKTRIKQRRDTSANWESKNPVLLNGEVIIVDTANGETRTKTGNGTKTYTQLPFDDEGAKGGKSLIDKSFADNVSTSGNTTTIDQQLKTYSVTTRLEADVVITGLDENGQEVTKHKLSEKVDSIELERIKYYGDKDIIPSLESYFTVNVTGETITGLTEAGKTQTELVIPYKINGVKITTLYSGVTSNPPVSILKGSSTITKVVIPKSVTTLGRGAFFNCKLTSMNIPNSVTSIGDYAFNMCSSLTSVKIPNSVISIGDYIFANCIALKSIDIPNSVTSIGDYAFNTCSALTSVKIPNSVTSIGNSAFLGRNPATLTIYCEQGSYAETHAKNNNNSVVYTDIKSTAIDNKVDKVEGKSLIDTGVANHISYADNSGFTLGRWSFNTADMTHTSPSGGTEDLKFAIDSGLTLTTTGDSGGFDITLVKGSKTHKLSEKLSTTRIADGENAGSLKIGRTSSLSTEGPYSIAIGFNGHTGPDGMGAVAINGGEALGAGSVAISSCTAKGDGQIAFGKLNITDTDNKYACIIGNGHVDSKGNKVYSNAYTIDWNGNAWFAGEVEGVKNGTTHKLSEKVDKVEGESLIDKSFADAVKYNIINGDSNTGMITMHHLTVTNEASISNISAQSVNVDGTVMCNETKADGTSTMHSLSNKAEAKVCTVSVPTTSWTEKTDTDNQKYYYKKITVSGMTASGQAMTDVAMSDSVATARKEMEAYQCVNRVVTGDDYVELYCFEEVPTTAFTLRILVISNILS